MTGKVILLILLLGAFLRFYNLTEVAHFEFDDQYNSYLVYDLIKNNHFSLVGQPGSFGGIFWGPWHYLYLVPFYLLTNLHPLGGYIGESIIGLIIIFSYYKIGSKIFTPAIGLLAAFLRAISMNLIINDRTISPSYPSELIAVWFLFFIIRLSQGSKFAVIALSFLVGMMTSIHVVIFPLILVWGITFIYFRPFRMDSKVIMKSLIAFMLPVSPLIIFEIKHNFVHVTGFLNTLISGGNTADVTFFVKLLYILNYNMQNFYKLFDSYVLPGWLGYLIFAMILILIWKTRKKIGIIYTFLFVVTFLVVVGYYLMYPRHVPEYYFLSLTPLILFYTSFIFVKMWSNRFGKIIVGLLLLVIVYSNARSFILSHQSPKKFGLANKDWAVKTIIDHQKGKGDFSVSYFTEYGRHYGFQYLFTYYGLEPRKEIKPPIYSIVMPRSQVADKDLSDFRGDIGLIFPEDEPEQGR